MNRDCECLACGQPAAVVEDDVLLCGDCFLEHTLRVLQAEDPRVRMMIELDLQQSA